MIGHYICVIQKINVPGTLQSYFKTLPILTGRGTDTISRATFADTHPLVKWVNKW